MTELTHTERETLAGVLAFIRRLVGAWDCCGTCAGGVLAAHDAAIRAEAKIQGVEEAAANMPLARTAQPYEGAAKWLRAHAAALRAAQPTEGES